MANSIETDALREIIRVSNSLRNDLPFGDACCHNMLMMREIATKAIEKAEVRI